MHIKLSPGIRLEFNDDELLVVNVETGFTAVGNKYAYEVLQLVDTDTTMEDIISALCSKYPESQHPRIAKSVPNVVNWAMERGIIEELPAG